MGALATSTPGANKVVQALGTGKIDPAWLPVVPSELGGTGVANDGTITNATDVNLSAGLGGGGQRADVVLDLFDHPDGLLDGVVTQTGQTWETSGTGAATVAIENGVMKCADTVYAALPYGDSIPRISGAFSFVSATDNVRSGIVVALIADNGNIVLDDMLHLIISPDTWVMQKRVGGGSFTTISEGSHALQPNTVYGAAFEIDVVNHTVKIFPPQGPAVIVTDSDIDTGAIDPQYGVWEIFVDPNGFLGQWHGASLGPMVSEAVRAMGFAAAVADAPMYLGSKFTRVQQRRYRLPTDGWYRIATAATFLTFMMQGTVRITAYDDADVRVNFWELEVSSLYNTAIPKLGQNFGGGLFYGIQFARLSNDSGSPAIGLDVYAAATNPVTIEVEFRGYFTPIDPPADEELTVGATVLPSAATYLTFLGNDEHVVASDLHVVGTINGRIKRRVATLVDGASVASNADVFDFANLTTTQNFTLSNPTGTPTDGQLIEYRFKSGSSYTITFGSDFRATTDLALPTATTGSSKWDRVLFEWNSDSSKWDILAKNFGA